MNEEAHRAFRAIIKAMNGNITPENCLTVLGQVWTWVKANMMQENTDE